MNVGRTLALQVYADEGCGDAHSSEDPRKGKSGDSEGALPRIVFKKKDCRPIDEGI